MLYYDRTGVLSSTGRSSAGYRLLDAGDARRLAAICEYRRVGLPLETIRRVLDEPDDVAGALAVRLVALDREAREVQRQRRAIVDYLGETGASPADRFTALLAAVGVDAHGPGRGPPGGAGTPGPETGQRRSSSTNVSA